MLAVLGYFTAMGGAWGFTALAVSMIAISPVQFVPPVLRLVVEEDSVVVRRQPPLRSPSVYLVVSVIAGGLILVVGYSGRSWGWQTAGAVIAVLGTILSMWGWSAQQFRVSPTAIDFDDGTSFPIDRVTASITWNYRSDDTLTVSAPKPRGGRARRGVALRSQGVHPNTMFSTIDQLRAWNAAGVLASPETIARMLSIPDQPEVGAKQTVALPLRVGDEAST
ncbi:hypothetical protein ACXVUM_13370 [Williamsia sp. SKLECPSW1]